MKWVASNEGFIHCGDYKIEFNAQADAAIYAVWFRATSLCACRTMASAKEVVAIHHEGGFSLARMVS